MLGLLVYNPDRIMRWVLWGHAVNFAWAFSPWRESLWRTGFIAGLLVTTLVRFLWARRRFKRINSAFKHLEQHGGFWANEMGRHLVELHEAEGRFASEPEKAEIEARLLEAKARFQREIAIYCNSTK
jgi:hypothetical protein